MRKRFKVKKRSCSLCKPHKTGWDKRFNIKNLNKLEQAEKEIEDARRR